MAVEFDELYLLEKASPEVAPKSVIAVFRDGNYPYITSRGPFLRIFIQLFLH